MNVLKYKLSLIGLMLFFCNIAFGTNGDNGGKETNEITVTGVVEENHNRGFRMAAVEVQIMDAVADTLVKVVKTNNRGVFTAMLPKGRTYEIVLDRKNFVPYVKEITPDQIEDGTVKLNLRMERKPGYVFDVTLKHQDDDSGNLDALKGARIEVYNNTTRTASLEYVNHPSSRFQFVFESGNYYTIMIRKKGFFNKRIEAYIDIEGCILCFDGLDVKSQEVIGTTNETNERGSFLADIVMQPIEINKSIKIENIYYDFDEAYIRPDAEKELDKLTGILRDNQHVALELGAHTDARGNDAYNLNLSDRRAKAAVEYLTAIDGISKTRLTWKGYGEEQLINHCTNGVECSEEEHQDNRRTELKIVGSFEDPLDSKTLKEIIEEGQKYQFMKLQQKKRAKQSKRTR